MLGRLAYQTIILSIAGISCERIEVSDENGIDSIAESLNLNEKNLDLQKNFKKNELFDIYYINLKMMWKEKIKLKKCSQRQIVVS